MWDYIDDLGSVDCNRRICRDIPPPSWGIFVNVTRSVSKPYIRGNAIINKEREHSLCSPTVELAARYCSSPSQHRARRLSIRRIAGECGEHFPNKYEYIDKICAWVNLTVYSYIKVFLMYKSLRLSKSYYQNCFSRVVIVVIALR